MIKAILRLITLCRSKRNNSIGNLYYLYGVKPIEANRRVIDECTVSRE